MSSRPYVFLFTGAFLLLVGLVANGDLVQIVGGAMMAFAAFLALGEWFCNDN